MSVYIERQKNVVFFFLSSPDGDEMYGEKKLKIMSWYYVKEFPELCGNDVVRHGNKVKKSKGL